MRYLFLILLLPVLAHAQTPDGVIVQLQGTGSLTWTPSTELNDGSPLTDIAGYNLHIGRSSGVYTDILPLAVGSSATFTLPITDENDLIWYMAITVYREPQEDPNNPGQFFGPRESIKSNEVVKTLTVVYTDLRDPKPVTDFNAELQIQCSTSDALVTCEVTVQ